MLLAKIDPQTTVEQVSSYTIVVVRDDKIIREFNGIADNALVKRAIAWAKGEEQIEKSQGHITVINGLEYFLRNGELYRASVANYVAPDGYRVGARWQAPAHLVKSTLATLGITQ